MSADDWQKLGDVKLPRKAAATQESAPAPKHYISRRAHTVWERMRIWYPNKLAAHAPADYCKVIDASKSLDALRTAMANMKVRHVSWPPTFPEFSLLFNEQRAKSINWPVILDEFANKLISSGEITFDQARRLNWHNDGARYTALSVPAIGDAPAKRFPIEVPK